MWWLDSEKQTIPIKAAAFSSRQRGALAAASKPPLAQPPRSHRPLIKCTSPLIDTLTSEQEQANRILSQVQCGHEVEIERLVADVGSLEKSIRQSSQKMESQQALLEEKESLLRSAEEKAEALQYSLAEYDGEIQRLESELDSGSTRRLATQLQHEKQVTDCEYEIMVAEHRLAELATVLNDQIHHRQRWDEQERKNKSEIASYRDQLADRESMLVQKNQQIDELQQLSGQLVDAKKRTARWQLETQRSHASRKSLADQMRRQKTEDATALQDAKSEITKLREQLVENELTVVQQNQEISELMQLHDQLASAEKRAATWQLETQRSHASRRALAEQARRQKAVDDETLLQSDSRRKQMEQKQQVAQLRIQRLRSENQQLEKKLQQERKGRIVDRRIRESETSEVQSSVQAKAIQIEQLKASVEMRDREIVGLKEGVIETQLQLSAAWDCSREAANHLQLRDAELLRSRENEERIVQMQADQAETLQSRIESLVSEQDAVNQSSRIDLESFERTLAELEDVIDQLGKNNEQLECGLKLAQQTNAALLTEIAKSHAQLSGGRAKGLLLIQRYEERLNQAIETIETLRKQVLPNATHGNRAA